VDATLKALSAVTFIFERSSNVREALASLLAAVNYVAERRPTLVAFFNSVNRVLKVVEEAILAGRTKEDVDELVRKSIEDVSREIEDAIAVAAALGARRVRDGSTLLTCSYSRSVKALLSRLRAEGKRIRVYVTESRPFGEGVRMAEEVSDMGFETELIVDSAVRYFMKNVNLVVVGAEAIAANGAVVNKVGTSLIALAAHEARVRTFVLTTTHKFSPETVFGELVRLPIVRHVSALPGLERHGDMNVECPLFDVTPPHYVDAIVTERGVVAPEAVVLLVREIYGWPPQITDTASYIQKLMKVISSGGSG